MKRFWILVALAMAGVLAGATTVWARGHKTRHPAKTCTTRRKGHQKPGHAQKCKKQQKRKHHKKRGQTKPPTPKPPVGVPAGGGAGGGGSPTIQHVVWIVMENTGYTGIIGNGSAPYINSLANTYGLATNYFAIGHPSAPNYVAMTSGTSGSNASCDCYVQENIPSIFSQLPRGQSRSLEEGMPSNCDTSDGGNKYAIRHNPMAYYAPVIGSDCQSFDVPMNNSAPDLSAKFTFLTPNTCNDMHDCSTQTGDTWLSQEIPAMTATAQYKAGTTAIFLLWDEDGNGFSDGNKVPMIVISPYTHGVKDGTSYTHYSLLRTTEELLGLPPIGSAGSANSMVGKFGF